MAFVAMKLLQVLDQIGLMIYLDFTSIKCIQERAISNFDLFHFKEKIRIFIPSLIEIADHDPRQGRHFFMHRAFIIDIHLFVALAKNHVRKLLSVDRRKFVIHN